MTGTCPASLALPSGRQVGGVKGHNINDNTLLGSPGVWPGSFTTLNEDDHLLEITNIGTAPTPFRCIKKRRIMRNYK